MSELLTGAEILCRALVDAGVDVIFGYPGGAIMPFYHALPDEDMTQARVVRQGVVERHDGAARIPEDHVDPGVDQRAAQDLRPREELAHR
ncbi:MAG TPA: thiamine pyrophosphate-binding protein, partial [Gemmatimonadales bacterium]|nr:thiamine pyrophosphate-binding protein [Gemmatimonadales bacterium]